MREAPALRASQPCSTRLQAIPLGSVLVVAVQELLLHVLAEGGDHVTAALDIQLQIQEGLSPLALVLHLHALHVHLGVSLEESGHSALN